MAVSGFTSTQISQLKELLDERLEAQDVRIVSELDRRFSQQERHVKAQFTEQSRLLKTQLAEERTYYRQLIKEELRDIREQLAQLSERTDQDDKAVLIDIERLERRVSRVEAALAKLP